MDKHKVILEARQRAKSLFPEIRVFDKITYDLACEYETKKDAFVKAFLLGYEYMEEQLKQNEYEAVQ